MALSWSQSGSDYTIAGTSPATLTKSSGPNWTNYCYTADTLSDFSATNIVASNPNTAVGVTDSSQLQSGDKDETSVRYGFYRAGGASPFWRVVVNGSGISSTDTVGTTAKMIFDGTDVTFYVDDAEIHSHTATVTSDLYGYASVYDDAENVTIQLQSGTPASTGTRLPPPPIVTGKQRHNRTDQK